MPRELGDRGAGPGVAGRAVWSRRAVLLQPAAGAESIGCGGNRIQVEVDAVVVDVETV